MNKKIIKLLTIIVIALIALGSACFYYYKIQQGSKNIAGPTKPLDIISRDEQDELNLYRLGIYEAISRDDKGKVTAYKFLGLKDQQEIKLDIMSDSEKTERHLDPSVRAQVLERDSAGKIKAYRVMQTDSDIISRY